MKYDIIVFVAEKYLHNHREVIAGIKNNIVEKPEKIYCVCPVPIDNKIEGIVYLNDNDILPFSTESTRKAWVKQQYMKLFQTATLTNYLVVDGDIIINKPIRLFDESGKINFFTSRHKSYPIFHRYIQKAFDLEPIHECTFVNDLMFFNRDIINEMILSRYESIEKYIEVSNSLMNVYCTISEYELYGTYAITFHRDKYQISEVKRKGPAAAKFPDDYYDLIQI